MYRLKQYFAVTSLLCAVVLIAAAGVTNAQETGRTQSATPTAGTGGNVQAVDARQSGVWDVGIDQARNAVQVANTAANPVAVKVIGSGSARKAFQARIIVAPTGIGNSTQNLLIPAGKRLVIENVSVITRCPEGLRMEVNFSSYIDNNGDGIGDISDITFHRISLVDQGVFDGTAIATANHKVLVFADEQIGTGHHVVGVTARLSATTTGFTQAQFTFSGYLEDLPVNQ